MRIKDECLIYLTPTLRTGSPDSQRGGLLTVSRVNELTVGSTPLGRGGDTSLPPRVSATPASSAQGRRHSLRCPHRCPAVGRSLRANVEVSLVEIHAQAFTPHDEVARVHNTVTVEVVRRTGAGDRYHARRIKLRCIPRKRSVGRGQINIRKRSSMRAVQSRMSNE